MATQECRKDAGSTNTVPLKMVLNTCLKHGFKSIMDSYALHVSRNTYINLWKWDYGNSTPPPFFAVSEHVHRVIAYQLSYVTAITYSSVEALWSACLPHHAPLMGLTNLVVPTENSTGLFYSFHSLVGSVLAIEGFTKKDKSLKAKSSFFSNLSNPEYLACTRA